MGAIPTLIEKFFGQVTDPNDDRNQARQLVDICQVISDIIAMQCDYTSAERSEICVRPSGKFFASGARHGDYSLLRIGIGDPRAWFRSVKAGGLEVISGCFILAVLESSDTSASVICIRQRRGCSVRPEIWLAEKAPEGWKLVKHQNDRVLLNALCAQPAGDHEPADDPVWHSYANVSGSRTKQLLNQLATLLQPKPPATEKSADEVDISNEFEN